MAKVEELERSGVDLLMAGAFSYASSSSLSGCVENFVETVVPSYTDASFYSHFRMTQDAMQVVVKVNYVLMLMVFTKKTFFYKTFHFLQRVIKLP